MQPARLWQAYQQDGGRIGARTHGEEAASSIAGRRVGAQVGVGPDAAIGSLAGPAAPSLVGIAGGIAGSSVGRDIFEGVASLF